MRVQFALCAQTASVDRASNRVSIFNVIDHIPAANLPLILPTITFVSILETDRGEAASYKGVFEGKLNGTVMARGEVPVNFVNGRLARVLLTLNGVPIREHGTLSFRLTIPNMATAEVQVQVVNLAAPEATASPARPPVIA
jgi:hypothetical protein